MSVRDESARDEFVRDELEKRYINFMHTIGETARKRIFQELVVEEYKKGNFLSIPIEELMFDDDVKEELRRIYRESEKKTKENDLSESDINDLQRYRKFLINCLGEEEYKRKTNEIYMNIRDEYQDEVPGLLRTFKELPQKIDDKKTFNDYKNLLLKTIGALNNTGALDELIKKENYSIEKINKYMSNGAKIKDVSKNSILNQIENLKFENGDHKIQLLVLCRHYMNKLAHNYDDYIFSELMNNTISAKEYNLLWEIEADSTIEEIRAHNNRLDAGMNYIEECLERINETDELDCFISSTEENFKKTFFQSSRKEELKDVLKENGTIENILKELGIVKKVSKIIKQFKIYNSKNPISNTKMNILNRIKGFVKESKKNEEVRFRSIYKYCKDKYEGDNGFEKLKSIFDKEKNSTNNGAFKYSEEMQKMTFSEFYELVIGTTEDEIGEKIKSINSGRDVENLRKIACDIKTFIEKLKTEYVIKNPEEIIKKLAQMADVRDQVYEAKHMLTSQIIEEANNGKIRIEISDKNNNDTYDANKKRAIDVFVDGFFQIFGTHGNKPDDRITEEAKEIINDNFKENNGINLCVNIPLAELTFEQRMEFRRIFNVIAMEEGKNPNALTSDEMTKVSSIQNLKNNGNSNEFNSLKVISALACGLSVYKAYIVDGIYPETEINQIRQTESETQECLRHFTEHGEYEDSTRVIRNIQRNMLRSQECEHEEQD